MPAKNPRVNVVVDNELFEVLKALAEERGESISSVVRRYIELGLSLAEDIGLAKVGEERLKTLRKEKTLTHEEVWD
ncbi:ribbon-helix-helix protein, CopG family [Hydrogenivirga sp. 128-5-R1-1]|uniref:ribbon-helix-helix protein, CopG family n=1 Tax=Hydrogenivirga sp. 128-5-R1-1 TaxID=392423 RepID=UPI00015F3398|nr:ribbon-helix-helix protein, CopG family [Hydrogenivirga sp. 128-5-R1-1]EDP74798.1 hypothetical protein HG1285_13057 [Hydrogenivirga sp. 128-5-R1-1]